MNTHLDGEKLLKPDLYQVFLLTCPASIPISFAAHPWFVVNKKGAVSRWEVFFPKHKTATRWGHLHTNWLPPFQGIEMVAYWQRYFWKGTLSGHVEGGEGSLAHRMAEFIEASPCTYPYCEKYSLVGINSNTYAQWVIDTFPECGFRLPWNAFGTHLTQIQGNSRL